jgi:hypothetical protein
LKEGYLMTEEPSRNGQYYNVSQSDLRGLVRGELNSLKSILNAAKNGAVNTGDKVSLSRLYTAH